MRRIDLYVQHLVRHNASEVEITSGQAVRFGFPSGDRHSNKAVDHATVTELLTEAAPSAALVDLKQTGQAQFLADAAGIVVDVRAEVVTPNHWRVILRPASAEPIAIPAPPRGPSFPEARNGFSDNSVEATVAEEAQAVRFSQHPPRPGQAPSRSVAPPRVSLSSNEPGINRYLRMMVELGASDLHLSSGVAPMVRLHGEMKIMENRAPHTSEELIAMIREFTPDPNMAEFSERNDTDFAHEIPGVARFRTNAFRDRKGVGLVFRQIPMGILSAEQLGIPPKVLDLCWLSKGLVLVTGPTGSGKSTTLAALIDFVNKNRSDHIITIEDPIEFVHENQKCLVNQREVGTHTKSFKAALRAALREDPDIVLVGELRDLETISIAIETAETGHLVFGTLHTTSAISTVDRIIDQFPPDRQEQIRVMLSESIRGVIAQMLCKKNGGGRVAAYEILVSNSAIANLIREGKTFQITSVMQTQKHLGMQTMNDHLMQLVAAGAVAPEEAYIKSNDKASLKQMFSKANVPLKLPEGR